MPTATGNFANMVKAGNLIDHAIKNGRIDTQEKSSKPKMGNFLKKKKGETQTVYQQSQPNQSRGYTSYQNHSNYKSHYSASSNQTSNVVPQYTLSITKHKLYKHAYLSRIVSQALQGLITLQIVSTIIPNLQNQQDLPWSQFRYHIPNCCLDSSKVNWCLVFHSFLWNLYILIGTTPMLAATTIMG